ncbi:MAG: DUF1320 family protein [Planctomycetota bacterium]|nr:DUF1320 family protein [Planctomycetota bacterium]
MTAYYCTEDAVTARLSEVGMVNLLDSNGDGVVDAAEKSLYLTTAIAYASGVIDGYIVNQVVPESARGSGNAWLSDRCVDLAVYRICGNKGRGVPQSVLDSKSETIDMLKTASQSSRGIPGYPYPSPSNTAYSHRGPKVANLGRVGASNPRSRGNFPNY